MKRLFIDMDNVLVDFQSRLNQVSEETKAANTSRLEEYLQEIGREDMLTLEEELALAKAIQQKGPNCEEAEWLVKGNLRFVVSVAYQYQNQVLTLEELIEVGNKALLEAAVKYEPSADSKFIRFVVPLIRQHILQAIKSKE